MRSLACLLAFFFVQFCALSFAKEKPPVLSVGMPVSEVLTRAGAPLSKKIMEIKREEEWYYSGYSVHFKDGLVTALGGSVAAQPSAVPLQIQTQQASGQRRSKETPPDLLRNILKELPAPTGSPGASGGGGGGPGGNPPQIAPAAPPGGGDEED